MLNNIPDNKIAILLYRILVSAFIAKIFGDIALSLLSETPEHYSWATSHPVEILIAIICGSLGFVTVWKFTKPMPAIADTINAEK